MATNIETMWVGDSEQLQRTVQNLVQRGGVVQAQSDTEVTLYIKKKMNVVVLVVGLILCLVPGLAYLIWYTTADQNQQMTVKIGSPDTIKTDHQHWYDEDAADRPGELPTAAPESAAAAPPAPGAIGTGDATSYIPPAPTPLPDPDPLPGVGGIVPPPPPAPPAPPGSSF